ncbi:MAG: galactokinase [Bacteroidales bacterium]|jgi:galactokinase|nr:galactokinase [Bacteroidales bacterium]MDD2264095.1 galactokinase [Bacteroidales bacterium]MDD2831434.1 galactokinase [Bacteroidales bacterium]MDD3208428.1 galactokinase [Bacteroidales bacterium]MDD3696889.1 galactokinase [Bacteroidales bacterium]
MDIDIIKKQFRDKFGDFGGELYTSPGRVNLIGEHTDYNGGFVFPGAIDKGMVAVIRKNGTGKVRAWSVDLQDYAEFTMEESDLPKASWARYIFGVCREIIKRGGNPGGFDTAFAGDVPMGAGMSSSAALESTYAFALNDMFFLGIDKFELARIGQATEHNYVGVKCGIMDQFASLFGKEGNLIRLDTRSMEYKYFPFHPQGYKLVLFDTAVKHELASSAYNKRRESCENATRIVRENGHPEVEFLRDVSMDMLYAVKEKLPAEDFKRAGYVIGETTRVLAVSDALERDDYETVGHMMYRTHYGMRDLYEVSCPELDFLNDIAKECGVTGSRVMGGGFGGCTINLVKEHLYGGFLIKAKEQFARRFGHKPKVYDVVISDGARRISQ